MIFQITKDEWETIKAYQHELASEPDNQAEPCHVEMDPDDVFLADTGDEATVYNWAGGVAYPVLDGVPIGAPEDSRPTWEYWDDVPTDLTPAHQI